MGAQQQRVVIVDFNHLAFNAWYGGFRASTRVVENGVPFDKDTTITNGTIKNINRWGNHGRNYLAVCFDRPNPARKAFFSDAFGMKEGTDKEYKGGRERMSNDMFQGIADTEHILRTSGIACFSENNYEADDLVSACVDRAKEIYPNLPIDVITNDADLVPLVDEQVSVFLRSKIATYAVDKSIEKPKYVQITPGNYQTIVENLSAYRGFNLPYNTLLLHKLLRGDSSDKFGVKEISRMFSAKKWNEMMERMIEDGINFSEIFRYGKPQVQILYKDTDKVFNGTTEEAIKSPDKGKLYQKISNSEELDAILWVLQHYSPITDEQLESIEKIYWGMNLNQPYPNEDKTKSRKSFKLATRDRGDLCTYEERALQSMLTPLRIRL